jgi:hypothetical protein
MLPREPTRLGALLVCIGGGAFVAGCVVFDGKAVLEPDGAIDSGASDSGTSDSGTSDTQPDTRSESATAVAPDPGIRCGANDWCLGDTVCCLKLGASGWFGPSTRCGPPGTCSNFSEFACATAGECVDGGAPTGDFCCATRESATTEFQGSACVPLEACMPASLAVVLCAPTGRAPCPASQSCVAADAGELPPGYYACQ